MTTTSLRLPKTSSSVCLPPDQLKSAPLRRAYQYWNQLRGTRAFPAREDMNARDMAGLLPYISLVKVIDGGADFEHRIVGDVVVRAFDVALQRRRFSEIAVEAPDLIERSSVAFRAVVDSRCPHAWRITTGRDSSHVVFTEAEMVLLPFGKNDNAVDHVASFTVHEACVAPSSYGPTGLTAP